MINPFPARITQVRNQITAAQSEISGLDDRLETLRVLRKRLIDAQRRCVSAARAYNSDNERFSRNITNKSNINRMRLARHCTRGFRKITTNFRRTAADRGTSNIARKIDQELERVRADISDREQRISTLRSQITSWNNQISNLQSQSAAWRPPMM